jgi:hypothetical protein
LQREVQLRQEIRLRLQRPDHRLGNLVGRHEDAILKNNLAARCIRTSPLSIDLSTALRLASKSIDINAPIYQNAARLTYKLNKFVDDLAEFKGASWGTDVVTESQIEHRVLSLAVPKGSIKAVQREIIDVVRMRARTSNINPRVDIIITEF